MRHDAEVVVVVVFKGWFRDGYCHTESTDSGVHAVCAQMTQEFLDFTKSKGNDLSTPRGNFPGLKTGDK